MKIESYFSTTSKKFLMCKCKIVETHVNTWYLFNSEKFISDVKLLKAV